MSGHVLLFSVLPFLLPFSLCVWPAARLYSATADEYSGGNSPQDEGWCADRRQARSDIIKARFCRCPWKCCSNSKQRRVWDIFRFCVEPKKNEKRDSYALLLHDSLEKLLLCRLYGFMLF